MEAYAVSETRTEHLEYAGNVEIPYVDIIKVLERPMRKAPGVAFPGGWWFYKWDFIIANGNFRGYFSLWSAEPRTQRRKQKLWHLSSSEDAETAKTMIMNILKGG